jgi:CzcA family heavy metal efflux pump
MLNKIIQYALANRLLIIAASILLLIAGIYTTSTMEVDVFPDLTAPTVVVLTEAHGMAPEEVERLVSFQIETSVNGATNVRRVRSSSAAGISIVWVEFEWGTDIYKARQIVNEKLLTIQEKLPRGVGNPTLAPQSSIMGEVMFVGLTSDSTSAMDLRTITDWNIRPRLLATGGVSQVIVMGGEYKQYQILASPQKMKHYNVTLNEVLKASEESNLNASGGFINEYGSEYILRGIGRTSDISEIGNSVIKVIHDIPIKISDVAEVKIGGAIPKIGDASLNAQPAVLLTIAKQPGTNTLELTKKIDETLIEIAKTLPPDIKLYTKIFRQADFIAASISNIQKALIEGSIFVVIIMFLFLMNFRTTIISLIAIPLSLIASIITLKYLGLTINTMSLGGMAIAIGSLVDDAVIDVENVFKRLKENALQPELEKKNTLQVVYNASKEIRSSIFNATLIIIVAFIPLFFLSGLEGRMLRPLGISFIVSLFASLVVAVTLTPVLCSYMLTNESKLLKQANGSWLENFLSKHYRNALGKAMGIKKLLLGLSIGLLIVVGFLISGLGRSFLPEFNEGSLTISAVSVPGISLEESSKIGNSIEKILLELPEISITARKTGRAELDEHAQGVNASEIEAPFELVDRDRTEFMAAVRKKLSTVTAANITIGQPISHRIDHMLSGTRANIAIKLFGTDLNKMFSLGNQIKSNIENIEGLVDLSVEQQVEIPQIQIKAKRDMLAKFGITIGEFTEFIDVAFAGEVVSQVFENEQNFDLVLRFDEENRGDIESIKNVLIDAHHGKIPLHYVATIISSMGPNTINRENVQRKIVISANVAERDLRSVVNEIKENINQNITLPENYSIQYGGQFESEEKAARTLLLTSIMSLLIIFLLLYQEFKDVKIASIILLNLPLALIGGVLSIWLTSGIISIPAIIGFITLFGIATRNGILLVSRYQTLQKEGVGLYETIMKGSLDRLNPILMTALTTALALIPLALTGDLPGNEIQNPMAIVILGGLLSSTLLNIFIVPIVYYYSNRSGEFLMINE